MIPITIITCMSADACLAVRDVHRILFRVQKRVHRDWYQCRAATLQYGMCARRVPHHLRSFRGERGPAASRTAEVRAYIQ